MDLSLKGRSALVTGASKGIGRAIARCLAAEGCNLYLAARNGDALSALARELSAEHGIDVKAIACDLSRSEETARLATEAKGAEILVNNAGAIPSGDIEAVSEEAWRSAWDLKVFGYINLTRHFYGAMKARGRGVIVNVIGLAGVRVDAGYIAGSAGNAALIAFTRALGARSVDFGVRVIGVNPSLTATERATGILRYRAEQQPDNPEFEQQFLARLPFARMAEPREIADMVAFVVSDRASYLSGEVVNVDGGISGRP